NYARRSAATKKGYGRCSTKERPNAVPSASRRSPKNVFEIMRSFSAFRSEVALSPQFQRIHSNSLVTNGIRSDQRAGVSSRVLMLGKRANCMFRYRTPPRLVGFKTEKVPGFKASSELPRLGVVLGASRQQELANPDVAPLTQLREERRASQS